MKVADALDGLVQVHVGEVRRLGRVGFNALLMCALKRPILTVLLVPTPVEEVLNTKALHLRVACHE
jgi:hypothetical protein